MLSYERFKEIVKKELPQYLPDVENLEIKEEEVLKVNQKKDSIQIFGDGISVSDGGIGNFSPTIYLDDLYKDYKMGISIDVLVEDIAERAKKANKVFPKQTNIEGDVLKADKVFFQLINTEKNKEMLKTMPHREYLDMSIIYRTLCYRNEYGIGSAMINNDIMKKMNLTEEELYKAAYENTEKLFPPVSEPISDMLEGKMDIPGELLFPPEAKVMYVITNSNGVNGAATMLYNEPLDNIARKLGTDLYILPSSIHEVIAVSTEIGDLEEISGIVRDVNENVIKPSEILSDNVYKYSMKEKKITQETDVKKDVQEYSKEQNQYKGRKL